MPTVPRGRHRERPANVLASRGFRCWQRWRWRWSPHESTARWRPSAATSRRQPCAARRMGAHPERDRRAAGGVAQRRRLARILVRRDRHPRRSFTTRRHSCGWCRTATRVLLDARYTEFLEGARHRRPRDPAAASRHGRRHRAGRALRDAAGRSRRLAHRRLRDCAVDGAGSTVKGRACRSVACPTSILTRLPRRRRQQPLARARLRRSAPARSPTRRTARRRSHAPAPAAIRARPAKSGCTCAQRAVICEDRAHDAPARRPGGTHRPR